MKFKFLPDLTDDNEYAIVCWGQSNARPLGTEAEAASVAPELFGSDHGASVTFSSVPGTIVGTDSAGNSVYALLISVGSLTTSAWAGAKIRLGTNTTPVTGYGTVVANDASTVYVTWDSVATTPGSASNVQGYVIWEDFKRASFPQVRVLTPYQPELREANLFTRTLDYPTPDGVTLAGGAARLVVPGYSLPSGVTGFQQMAVFLPYSNHEGQNGYGESDVYPAANPALTSTSTSLTVTSMAAPDNYFTGGYLVIEYEDGGQVRRSWGRVTASNNAAKTYTVDAWSGDTPPASIPAGARWTAWVPYIDDSPYAYLPGIEFAYPNSDMQPPGAVATGPMIRYRARGQTVNNYGNKVVGAWLNFAVRMSAALGKRIHLIHLGVDGSSLFRSETFQPGGFQGTWGWWNYQRTHDWDPSRSDGLWARLKEMIYPMAGYALTAEGNSKPLKILAIAGMHGEADTGKIGGREIYGETLSRYVEELRDYIDANGLNPYDSPARIPLIEPTIAANPNELVDLEGLVNDGIRKVVAADEFAGTFEPDEAERNATANIHYDGAGYMRIGAWLHEAAVPLIEHSLSYGSTSVSTETNGILEICNRALGLIGESQRITSLSDGSFEAQLCTDYFPDARDALLQIRRWTFAERRELLLPAIRPQPTDNYEHYEYCYYVPAEAFCGFALLPGQLGGSGLASSNFTALSDYTYDEPSIRAEESEAFIIEEVNGIRYLFTNLANAVLRYTTRRPDVTTYSPSFRQALSFMLAANLAGPIIKGEQGEATADRLMRKALAHANAGQVSDGNQRFTKPDFIPDHLADR